MTIKYKRSSNGDWDTDDEWSTASGTSPGDQDTTFPTAGDDVIFDSNSGNCTLDANAACDSITASVAGSYSGSFSAAGFDMDVGGNCELESGTWTMGVGTWNVAGGMQHASSTNWIGDGATIDFDGSGSFSWTQINDASDRAANIIVRAGVTLTPASRIYATNYDIYGTVPLGSGSNRLQNYAGEIKVRSGGEISGTGTTFIQLESSPNTKGFTLNEGTVSVSLIHFVSPVTTAGETALIAPGTYDADVKVSAFSGTSATAKSQLSTVAGTVTITGDLWILDGSGNRDVEFTNVVGCVLNIVGDLLIDDISTSAGGIVEFDNSANNQTMTISGDITMTTLGTGTVTFTKSGAGGTVTFSGNNNQNIDALSQDMGSITITKAGTGIIDLQSGDFELGANSSIYGLAISGDTAFDAFNSDVALGAGGLDCTNGAGAALSMGSGTWTITGGTFDYSLIGTFNDDTSMIVFAGTCSWIAKGSGSRDVRDVTIASGTATLTAASGNPIVTGTIAIGASSTLLVGTGTILNVNNGILTTGANSRLGGAGTIAMYAVGSGKGYTTRGAGTTIDIAFFPIRPVTTSPSLPAGDYSTAFRIYNTAGANGLLTLSAGSYSFDSLELESRNNAGTINLEVAAADDITVAGELLFDIDNAADITIDGSAGDCNWILQGDVTQAEAAAGRLVWTAGTGTMTLSGTAAQAIDFNGQTVEAITIDNASGTVTFGDAVTTAAFTGEPNASIAGAVLITVQGNFALNGTSGNEITFNGPDLDVTGTAEAHFTTATNSDASAGEEVDALDNCTDGGGNSNWDFEQSSSSSSATSSSQTSSSSSSSSSSSIVAGQAVSTSQLMLMGVGT